MGCVNGEIILQTAAALWEAGAEPQETATPWPTPTRLVPPSPTTPRATRSVATPTRSGASNLDAIIDEGTLTIGWVGSALLGILIAAFGWAGRVFESLGTLATWLFSGAWRGGGSCESGQVGLTFGFTRPQAQSIKDSDVEKTRQNWVPVGERSKAKRVGWKPLLGCFMLL